MNHPFRRQESGPRSQSILLAALRFFNGILCWLEGTFQLTEKEKEDAGIYLGGPRDR